MAILHAKQATTATIEQERRPKELRLLAMLIAIANTAVKAREREQERVSYAQYCDRREGNTLGVEKKLVLS